MRTAEQILFPLHDQCPEELEMIYSHGNALKAMDEYAKEVALKFSEYWGQITPEQLQYFIVEDGTPLPIVQYKTRAEVFDEWISNLYQQETSSLK